jgi:hypothetical protein
MAKKNTIEIAKQVIKKPVIQPTIHSISLIIGSWKEQFMDEQIKLIIAEALNYCTCNHKLHIVGYLITKRRVCLVLKIIEADLTKILDVFFEKVGKLIRQHQEHVRSQNFKTYEKENIIQIARLFKDLFIQIPLINAHLIKLITGRPVVLPYYNPHLARLKDRIHNYNFCSAIDYSGAKGPVVVTLLEEKAEF